MKLIQRIIVSPLMLLLLLSYYLFSAVERWVSYLRYGGEVITYDRDSKKMIQDVYELVLTQIRRDDTQRQTEQVVSERHGKG